LLAGRVSVLRRPLYWAGWLLPALAVIAAWVMERRRRHLAGNVALARAQGARRLARKRLSVARRLSEEDEDAAYQAVAQVLAEYLGDKCNLPAAGLTRDAIELALTERAVNEEWIERLLTCLDWADAGRFAPVAAGRDARQLVDEAEEIIAELEAQIVA